MSVEIILRDDMTDYEAKPMFGYSYRQAATIALIVLLGYFTQAALMPILGDVKLVGCVIVLEAALIGLVGFGKFKGLRAEQYVSAIIQDFCVPSHITYTAPLVVGATDKKLIALPATMTRKQRKKASKEKEGDEINA